MYIHGEFLNIRGERVAVRILTNGDRSEELEIGTEESGLWFPAESPVVVENEVNDTFDVLLRRSAKITLLCRNYVPEFFCTSARSAVVNVHKDGKCVFAGFLEPQTYSQPYNEVLDELELNCLDALSGLQYMNYKAVGSLGVVYEIVRSETSQRTFGELVLEVLREVSKGLDVLEALGGLEAGAVDAGSLHVWFDGSKGASKEGCQGTTVFDELAVNDLLFMGGSADEVWQQSEVLEEVLKFLDLHVVQDGLEFYIFSWETVKGIAIGELDVLEGLDVLEASQDASAQGAITWYELGGDGGTRETERKEVTISLDNVEGMDTEISIGEVYNQLLLTADMEKVENVVENPLDSESLTNAYDGMQKYMTEYAVDIQGLKKEWKQYSNTGQIRPSSPWYYEWKAEDEKSTNYKDSYNAFSALVRGQRTTYKDAYATDWYIRVKRHAHWRFPMGDWTPADGKASLSADEDLTAYAVRTGEGQHKIMNWLDSTTGKGCIASFGSVKTCMADGDNSTPRPSMENRLVIGVGGSWVSAESEYPGHDKALIAYQAIVERMKKNRPCAVYEGTEAAGAFSPSDEAITNYIVLSGKITLNPVTPEYAHLPDVRQNMERHPSWSDEEKFLFVHPMPSTDVEYKGDMLGNRTAVDDVSYKLYTQQYWRAADPLAAPSEDLTVMGLHPMTGFQTSLQYGSGRVGDWMNEYPVLSCMLIIGDKCVVETGVLGVSPSYEWRTYKTREECKSDDEYYRQCFYISFCPKVGEYSLGVEHDMMNNVTLQMGIDAEGIAIPMKKQDKLVGAARFVIIGPVALSCNFLRWDIYEDFDDTSYLFLGSPLMYTRSIELKDFEVKVYSDSGHYDSGSDDKDVVYMSDTKEKFVNRKEDIEFKINSALTAAECRSLGVQNSVSMSTPVNTVTGAGVLTIYDKSRDEAAKAEQLYVDSYYTEYHKPRILLTQTVRDDANVVGLFNHYVHPALGKEFYVQGVGHDLMAGEATLTLKEK